MKYNARSFATFGARRRLTWGRPQRVRSAKPLSGNPFFRPTPTPAVEAKPMRLAA